MKFHKITDLTLYYISLVFSYSYFWIALAVPYLMWRGLTGIEAFSLMSLYQLVGVVIEYPTSVLGDRYGYRRVVILGNIFSALAMFILAQNGTYWHYFVGLAVLALGTGLMSGNEQGMLKQISSRVRYDTAKRSSIAEFVLFLSAIIGGWLGGISYTFALYLSGVLMLSAVIPLLFIRNQSTKKSSVHGIKKIILDGLRALTDRIFLQMFIVLAVFGGFFFTIKSIFGSFGDLYNYPVELIGIIVGFGALSRSLGSGIYAKFQTLTKLPLLIVMSLMLIILSLSSPSIIIIILLIFQLLVGYVLSSIDGDIQDLAQDHIRSSIFSFKRLIMKLFSSGYLFVYGLMVDLGLFSIMMIGLGLSMLLVAYLTRSYTRVNLSHK
jgi:MFS family permease